MSNPQEVICVCRRVLRAEIEQAVRQQGLTTVEEVSRATGAGYDCGACWDEIEEILATVNGPKASAHE